MFKFTRNVGGCLGITRSGAKRVRAVAGTIRWFSSGTVLQKNKYNSVLLSSDRLRHLEFDKHYKIRSNIELLIQDYAKKPIPPLTFQYLTDYQPPLSKNEEYMLTIKTINLLLSYTCRRLNAIQQLPYVAVVNPSIEKSYSLYLKTLESLLSIEFPYALHNRDAIHGLLIEFLDDHQDTVETLSRGLEEIMDYIPRELIFDFLDHHLRDRIAMKILVTHHLSLANYDPEKHKNTIGTIHKDFPIADIVKRVSEFVSDLCFVKYDHVVAPVKIVSGADVTFPCIPTILEYVLTEILKNSYRAHIENSTESRNLIDKPVEINIVKNQNYDEELEIRIRDFGGGIPPKVEEHIFEYSYTTVVANKKETGSSAYVIPGEDINIVSGMGFGLPLCKAYVEMFDGTLEIQSLWGWGTDVYIKLKGPSKKMLESQVKDN